MLTVSVQILGTNEELTRLKTLGDKLTNFDSAMKQIGSELKDYYGGQVFSSQGGELGETWAALSPVYKTWKAKHYPGKGILVATGAMKDSFKADTDATSATITNDAPYFKYHQSTEPRRKLPRRPMLGISKGVESIVKQVIQNDIEAKLRKLS